RRLDRVALGAACRRLRPRDRRGARASATVKPAVWLLGAAAILAAAFATGALVGPVHIGLGEALRSFGSRLPFLHVRAPADDAIFWQIRLPRVVLGALVGAMLALAGASYQGVFR